MAPDNVSTKGWGESYIHPTPRRIASQLLACSCSSFLRNKRLFESPSPSAPYPCLLLCQVEAPGHSLLSQGLHSGADSSGCSVKPSQQAWALAGQGTSGRGPVGLC